MPAHPHAELMRQYAEDALTTDEPHKKWQYKGELDKNWKDCDYGPAWTKSASYRRKPRTILINGIEVPEPMEIPPPLGEYYYSAIPWRTMYDSPPRASKCKWDNDKLDHFVFKSGFAHSTEEAALKHAQALISFTKLPE